MDVRTDQAIDRVVPEGSVQARATEVVDAGDVPGTVVPIAQVDHARCVDGTRQLARVFSIALRNAIGVRDGTHVARVVVPNAGNVGHRLVGLPSASG